MTPFTLSALGVALKIAVKPELRIGKFVFVHEPLFTKQAVFTEVTGGGVELAANSKAPMSIAAPCVLDEPSKSTVTPETAIPLSTAGLVLFTLKSVTST